MPAKGTEAKKDNAPKVEAIKEVQKQTGVTAPVTEVETDAKKLRKCRAELGKVRKEITALEEALRIQESKNAVLFNENKTLKQKMQDIKDDATHNLDNLMKNIHASQAIIETSVNVAVAAHNKSMK